MVRESIIEVLKTLAEAIGLVILVMFLFLQNWRSTIIPAITIPVSLIGTFAFIKLFDFSINTLTLFGIVLATGIVVDDAIVVIENIERHMREYKKTARQAAIDAMREVFGAVVVIGIVLVAVFVPVAFFPGTTGRLYQQFSLTIAFAVVLSVFNAVTLTPALSALLLDKREPHARPLLHGVNRGDRRAARTSTCAWCGGALRLRCAMLLLFVVGLCAHLDGCSRLVPSAFVPEEDEGYFICVVQAPAGRVARIHDRDRRSRPRRSCCADPDIAAVFSVVGFSFTGAAPNNGMIFARLKDCDERRESGSVARGRAAAGSAGRCSGFPGRSSCRSRRRRFRASRLFGGFQFEVLDQTGGPTSTAWRQATSG